MDEWEMEKSKSVTSPGTPEEKANLEGKQKEEELLDDSESKTYRRAAARINYMALDRTDLSYAAKEVSRGMFFMGHVCKRTGRRRVAGPQHNNTTTQQHNITA